MTALAFMIAKTTPKHHSMAFRIHTHTTYYFIHAIADAVDLANLKAKISLDRSQFNLMVLGVYRHIWKPMGYEYSASSLCALCPNPTRQSGTMALLPHKNRVCGIIGLNNHAPQHTCVFSALRSCLTIYLG